MRQLELWVGDSYSQLLFNYSNKTSLLDPAIDPFYFRCPSRSQDGGDHLPGDAGHVLRDSRLRALLLLRPLLQELDLVEGHVRPPAPPHHEPLLRPPRAGTAGKFPFIIIITSKQFFIGSFYRMLWLVIQRSFLRNALFGSRFLYFDFIPMSTKFSVCQSKISLLWKVCVYFDILYLKFSYERSKG